MSFSTQKCFLLCVIALCGLWIIYTYSITDSFDEIDILELSINDGVAVSPLSVDHPRKQWEYVYFQHIRKSGGTAFNQLLLNNKLNDPNRQVIYQQDQSINESFRIIKQRMINLDVHLVTVEYFPFYVTEYMKYREEGQLFGDVLLVTVFRNPLDRIFSDLLYLGTWQCYDWWHYTNWSVSELEPSLIECLHKYHAKYTSNVYTKVFSGVWPYGVLYNRFLRQRGVDFNMNVNLTSIHLELAKLILSEFDIVIILEMWNETKIQLKCNGLNNDTLPHLNEGEWKQEIGVTLDEMVTLKEEMIRMNFYDLQLYHFAKKVAMERVHGCRNELVAYATHFEP